MRLFLVIQTGYGTSREPFTLLDINLNRLATGGHHKAGGSEVYGDMRYCIPYI